jgi:hemoglobin
MRYLLAIALSLSTVACSALEPSASAVKPKDGELAFPAGYTAWPKVVTDVARPELKQVRSIYVNTAGAKTKAGQPFPNGTTFVMELYKAEDGNKGALAKVFIMSKDAGWGANAPQGLGNGDWIYTSFDAKGAKIEGSQDACRSCHLPLDAKDFVHRYDEIITSLSAK